MMSKKVCGSNRSAMTTLAPGEQWHQDADHDAVDVEQRQDQQTPIRRSDVQRLAPHLGHRIELA